MLTPVSPFRTPTRLSPKRQVWKLDSEIEREAFYAINAGKDTGLSVLGLHTGSYLTTPTGSSLPSTVTTVGATNESLYPQGGVKYITSCRIYLSTERPSCDLIVPDGMIAIITRKERNYTELKGERFYNRFGTPSLAGRRSYSENQNARLPRTGERLSEYPLTKRDDAKATRRRKTRGGTVPSPKTDPQRPTVMVKRDPPTRDNAGESIQ